MRVRGGVSVTNLFATQKQSLKRFLRVDKGQALVLTALALVVLVLMAGLGVDVGYLRYQKQQMQKAADAGALAGATALAYNGNWNAAAIADVNANGFSATKSDGTSTGVTITVAKPWEGSFAGQDGYVEVSVSQPQPTFFMRVVPGHDTVAVRSWAVASALAPPSGCMYSLAPSGSDTFDVRGAVGIGSACAIYIDSSDSAAFDKKGGSGTVKASYIGIVGGCTGSGGSGCAPPEVVSDLSSEQKPVRGIAPFTDPLLNVPEPTRDPVCIKNQPVGNTYHPGTYCNGITLHGNGMYTFAPGLYTLIGGLTASGNLTLTDNGLGVTFYLTGTAPGYNDYGGVSFHGNVQTAFSAPTSGPQAGILFFQDRKVPVGSAPSTFGGNSSQVYTGALYFPTTGIQYRGTPDLSAYSMIMVGWTLQFRGNVTISQYTFLPGGGGPIHGATLAE